MESDAYSPMKRSDRQIEGMFTVHQWYSKACVQKSHDITVHYSLHQSHDYCTHYTNRLQSALKQLNIEI